MNLQRPKIAQSLDSPGWLELIRQQVNSLQFGTVEIVVHDSRVVQIEKTERVRLGNTEANKLPLLAPAVTVPGPQPSA